MTDHAPGEQHVAKRVRLSFHARDARETEQLASVMGDVIASQSVAARRLMPPVVVALLGALGAGKTAFARGLAFGFGVRDSQVSSPTFTLRMDHNGGDPEQLVLFAHLDCWRMETGALESVGWDQLVQEPNALIAVEWPQRIADSLPQRRIEVTIHHVQEAASAEGAQSRRVDVDCAHLAQCDAAFAARLMDALELLSQAPRVRDPGCARCGSALSNEAFAPFCTARCRLLDLGDWLRGNYVIEGTDESLDDGSGEMA